MDKTTSDRILAEVEKLTNQLGTLEMKAKSVKTDHLEAKIDAAMRELQRPSTQQNSIKEIGKNAEAFREATDTESGFMITYVLIGIVLVVFLATWWSFRASEKKFTN
jgi:hypothetical protein